MSDRRYVIIGGGAVGGALAAELVPSGRDVVLVARGEHGRRIAENGLVVRRPDRVDTVAVTTAAGPDDVELRTSDVLLLATKSQDADAALAQWAWQPVEGGGVAADLPIVTFQNGLATEDAALRRFGTVVGATIAIAASYLTPGEIVSPSRPPAVGVIWLGRHPHGAEQLGIGTDLRESGFAVRQVDEIARYKAAKLLGNVGNALDLFDGSDDERQQARGLLQQEALAAFEAAGIALPPGGTLDVADAGFAVEPVTGHANGKLSTWQSFARGASSEVDLLNGEIVLLGRRHGVPTPVNARAQRLLGTDGGGALRDVLIDRADDHR